MYMYMYILCSCVHVHVHSVFPLYSGARTETSTRVRAADGYDTEGVRY